MFEKLIVSSNGVIVSSNRINVYNNPSNLKKPLPSPYEAPTKTLMVESREQTAHNVRKLVEKIQNSGTDITDYYKDWFSIGCSLASEFGESGRNWYHIISEQSPKYKPDECNRQYDKCLRCCSRTSIRTFFYFCKQFGILLEQNLKQTLSKTQNNPDNPLGFLETPKKPLKNP